MKLVGIIQNGVVVLENAPALSDGTRVRVTVEPTEVDCESLREFLLSIAGTVDGLPSDFAAEHDHYIHGTPKRKGN